MCHLQMHWAEMQSCVVIERQVKLFTVQYVFGAVNKLNLSLL
jgi:hypothetical protein